MDVLGSMVQDNQTSGDAHVVPAFVKDGGLSNALRYRNLPAYDTKRDSYLGIVRLGQEALQRQDIQSADRLATLAKGMDPGRLPALELKQGVTAAGANPGDADVAALEAIAHGGKAVFELQHFHRLPMDLHSARIVITATSLEFIPEAHCKTGPLTIPLASIRSVQIGENARGLTDLYLLDITFDSPNSSKGTTASRQLRFGDSSSHSGTASTADQFAPQLSSSQERVLFIAIRNVILAAKARSKPILA